MALAERKNSTRIRMHTGFVLAASRSDIEASENTCTGGDVCSSLFLDKTKGKIHSADKQGNAPA